MKRAVYTVLAVLLVVVLVLLPVIFMMDAAADTELPVATPVASVTRTDNSGPGSLNSGRRVHIPTDLPTVKVTIQIPGPTKTVTVRAEPRVSTRTVPGPTRTVTAPGPTSTVTAPGPTTTVSPSPQETETVEVPGPTVTIGGSPPSDTDTRQGGAVGGTIDDKDSPINLGDGKTTVVEGAIGLLTLLAFMALLLATLWAGYALGYKDMQGKDSDFMRALLDKAKLRH